ncbi:hypothetical protein HMPREF1556_00179 [Porphyromonas sp. oral taxon 278 str. W7784]|nr:hypothetical protein HMPREF1556_00179 [Porphyromonas sp. oral taxon 278 str. W7784]
MHLFFDHFALFVPLRPPFSEGRRRGKKLSLRSNLLLLPR